MARPAQSRRLFSSREGTQARVVRNTLANASGTVVTVAATLVLTPFMIHELGVEAYGVWILATTLTFGLGYLSFADLGFEQAAVRYIAEARSAGDGEEVNRLWLTAFALLSGITLVLTPILLALVGPLVDLFGVPEELHDDAVIAFSFVLAQLLFELPGRAFAAVLEGVQRYGLWQVARVVQALSVSAGILIALLTGGGIDWLGIATFIGQGLAFVVLAIFALTQPGIAVRRHHITREAARKLASYGGQLLIFRILSSLYRPMDKVIIGIALSASAVTTYEVGYKFYTGVAMFLTLATSALVPATAFSREEPHRLRELLLRGSSYTLALALPLLTGIFIFIEPLIRTWIGEELTVASGPARLLMLDLVPGFAIAVGQTMLVALGIVRRLIVIVTAWTFLNIGLSIVLVGPWGINGVLIATLIASGLAFIPIMWLVLGKLGVGPFEWARDVVGPVLPGLAAQIGVGLLLLPVAQDTGSLIVVAALSVVSMAASVAAWLFVGLSGQRRRELLQMVRETAGLAPSEPMADPP